MFSAEGLIGGWKDLAAFVETRISVDLLNKSLIFRYPGYRFALDRSPAPLGPTMHFAVIR